MTTLYLDKTDGDKDRTCNLGKAFIGRVCNKVYRKDKRSEVCSLKNAFLE